MTEATFTTPHNIARRGWSSGFLLRGTGDGKSHAVLIHRSGEWSHYLGSDDPEDASLVATGSSQNIRIGREAQNRVLVMASGSIGWLFINGVYEAELDLRGLVGPGSISLVGAWRAGGEFPGFTVPFSHFTVQPLGRRFGPEKGTIEHNPGDEHIDTYPSTAWMADGIIEARFLNPYSASEGDWTSGFLIRKGSADEHHAVFIDDDGGWHHYVRMMGADTKLAEGSSEHIATSPSGSNHIRIVALGEGGLLFVNGAFVSTLDLSRLVLSGNVAGVGAYFSSHAIAGKLTSLEDFSVWSVGTVTAPESEPAPATATPSPVVTPSSIATPAQATSTRTPTATPTPVSASTPTASTSNQRVGPQPHLKHLEQKEYMLTLINAEREKAGVDPVVLGTNDAAQLHADASLEHCFSSHWGVNGLKPYMRYSLAGGYQSNGENGHGSDYCIKTSDGYRALGKIDGEIRDAMDDWMNSPGHRRNVLDPWHKKINIGLAWDRYNFKAYQHFEGDYVEFDQLPSIEDGVLSMSGKAKNDVAFNEGRDLGVQVYYDQPPRTLTGGQVARTYCYDSGLPIASLREPLTGGWFYSEDEYSRSYGPCPDPYDVPPESPPPSSHTEAHRFWQEAYDASQAINEVLITLPWITALNWTAKDEAFSVRADLSDLVAEHGAGVYSLIVWGKIDGESVVISQYSIFHDVSPPNIYSGATP